MKRLALKSKSNTIAMYHKITDKNISRKQIFFVTLISTWADGGRGRLEWRERESERETK